MVFKEDFPSLKGYADLSATPQFIMIVNGGLKSQGYYGEEKIIESCLDKQKVEKVFNRITHLSRKGFRIVESDLVKFKKELGLK